MPQISSFQFVVGEWAKETFPAQTNESNIAHLMREVKELKKGNTEEEAADCFLILLNIAHREGFDLCRAAEKKFSINRKRKWGKPDSQGVVEHIKG